MEAKAFDLAQLAQSIAFTGDLDHDAPAFLVHHGVAETAEHCRSVAEMAETIALRVGVDAAQAKTGGWLHDISTIIPNAERIEVAERWSVDVLPEEAAFPMIIHQKLSVVVAREVFGIIDEAVLNAIGCHTTLKKDATPLDKVVFVADKFAWDQPGKAPFYDAIEAGLEQSLDASCAAYLRYLWGRRESLRVVHPWMIEAYQQLA